MKAVFLSLIAVFILSCGGPEVECKEKFKAGGIEVCSEGKLSAKEVEYAVQVVEEQTALVYPEVINLKGMLDKHNVHVYFIDDALSMECEELEHGIYRCDKNIGGVNVDGDLMYVRYHKCLAYTSLGHEILHSIERYYIKNKMVTDHKTPGLFEEADWDNYRNTVEYKIYRELFLNIDSCAEERTRLGYQ